MRDDPWLGPYAQIAEIRRRARQILGVGPGDGPEEIRRAFLALTRAHHPDRGGDPARFRNIVNAYLALTRADPRGFRLEAGRETLPVPRTRREYLAWWRRRFFGP